MRILIVKLSSLGDVIQTMPVVADMLRAYPDAQIDWVVEEGFAPLVHRVQGVRRVLAIAQRRWRKDRRSPLHVKERLAFERALHEEAYDAVIDFQGLVKSAWVARKARLTPGGFSATYANASEACSYEWPVRWLLQRSFEMPRRIHAVARYRTLAHAALGCDNDGPAHYGLQASPRDAHDDAPTVVLAHGTTRADNEWPQENWIALGQRLSQQGVSIALPQASDREEAFALRVQQQVDAHARSVDSPARAIVWPRMTLEALMDRMAGTIGVIGVDSGLSHLAVALDLPHVQIFSQPRAWRAGPVGCDYQVSVGGDAAPDIDAVWLAWETVRQARR